LNGDIEQLSCVREQVINDYLSDVDSALCCTRAVFPDTNEIGGARPGTEIDHCVQNHQGDVHQQGGSWSEEFLFRVGVVSGIAH